MQICTLTLLGLIYGSNGIHATDLHTDPRHNDALHNGSSLTDPAFFMDSSSSGHDPSLHFPGLHDDHPDSSGLYESVFYHDRDFQLDPVSLNLQNDSLSPDLYSYPDSVQKNFRIRKDAPTDKAHDFLNHTAIVAHIVNGIAIQTGLMNGKIKMDELVGELLNFGDVPVSAIASFNPTAITTLTSKLKGIQSSLKSDFKDYEDQALKWNKLIEDSLTVGDLKNLPGKDEYITAVTSFTKSNIDPLSAPASALQILLGELVTIQDAKFKSQTEKNKAYSAFDSLFKSLNTTVTEIQTFTKIVTSLKKTKLDTGPTVYGPVEKMIELKLRRKDFNSAVLPPKTKVMKSNLKVVSELSTDSKASTQDVANIANLARESRPRLNKKKFTDGFPNGLADVKQLVTEVRDPWILKITKSDGSGLAVLSDGLQPLFKTNDRLIKLNEKFKTISSKKSSQSLLSMKQLQQKLSSLNPEVVNFFEKVLGEYHSCKNKATIVDDSVFGDINQVIKNAKALKDVTNFDLSGLNLKNLQDKIDKFIKFLGFKDIKNEPQSIKQLPEVLQRIKDTDGLKDIRTAITEVKNIFDTLDTTDLKTKADSIVTHGNTISDASFTDEKTLHACLQKSKKNSAEVALALSAVQELRKLNLDEISDVESSVSILSEVSKDLVEIEKLPESMKKDAKPTVVDLNKFPDSMAKSKIIGQSVSSLHYAYALKDLESEVAQLKSVKTAVDTEIQKVSPADRPLLLKQWGDHNLEMVSLEKTIADVKDFDSKLDVSNAKTMGEYSSPLEKLTTITDPTINPFEKSKVLESLLAQSNLDPNVKSQLELSKKTLDKLTHLDLAFSSYSSQYQSAPGAFKALHDFLASFLKEDHSVITVIKDGNGGNPAFWVAGSVMGSFAVAIACTWIFVECLKLCWKKKCKKLTSEWITDHEFKSKKQASVLLGETMNCVFAHSKINASLEKSLDFLPVKAHRYPTGVPCNPDTAVKFHAKGKEIRIHANLVNIKKDKYKRRIPWKKEILRRYIATQGPLPDTMTDFWLMMMHFKCEFIVMLCLFMEGEGDEKYEKCGEYFHPKAGKSKKFDSITVLTESVNVIMDGAVEERRLKITDSEQKGGRAQYITHYQYLNWPDKRIPEGHDDMIKLLNMVKKSKKPITVHCSAGIGRTVSFIGLDYLAAEVKYNPDYSLMQIMKELREFRWYGIQTIQQLYWVLTGAIRVLIEEFGFDKKRYDKQMKVFNDAAKLIFVNDAYEGYLKNNNYTKLQYREALVHEGVKFDDDFDDDHDIINEEKRKINIRNQLVDINGKLINRAGEWVNEHGQRVDKHGKLLPNAGATAGNAPRQAAKGDEESEVEDSLEEPVHVEVVNEDEEN